MDSGADVSMVPWQFCAAGDAVHGVAARLRDAQGGVIPTGGISKVQFECEGFDHELHIIRENVHVGGIGSPILSFGRLICRMAGVLQQMCKQVSVAWCM